MRYAQSTNVSVDRSRAEIERLIMKYGANNFGSALSNNQAIIIFEMNGRRIKFILSLPLRSEKRFTHKEKYGRIVTVSLEECYRRWEQECRRLWRALSLNIKAKLESVESKISSFDDEFLPHIVMPNGKTIKELLIPQIETAYQTHKMPPLLLGN